MQEGGPTTTANLVLRRLQADEGGPLSGQQIADELRISRNAVWKAVAALREAGCVIDAGPRSGYTLVSVPEPLDEASVLSGVDHPLFTSVHFEPVVGSTNDVAKALAKKGAAQGTIVITERQTRGRGRRGRAWETGAGQSLLFSVLLRPEFPPRQAPLLVFLAAAAVRHALQPYVPAFIKWPNDVVAEDGRKLCGILVEMDAEHDRVRHCIVGIGLNVNQRSQDFPAPLRPEAASVRELYGKPVDRRQLLHSLLHQFALRYEAAVRTNPADFTGVLAEARRHSATIGRAVRVHEQGGADWYGRAVDIRADGALLVRPVDASADAGPVPVFAADVSIRMEDDDDAS